MQQNISEHVYASLELPLARRSVQCQTELTMEAEMLQEAGEEDDIDFSKYDDVVLAFTSLMAMLHKNVTECQLQIIKARCIAVIDGIFRDSIENEADSVDNFFMLLSKNTLYCNWLNIQLVEVIATASGNKKLEDLVSNYRTEIYSRTLKQVYKYIPQDYKKNKFHQEVKMKISKSPDNVTVGDLIKYNCLFPNKIYIASLYVSIAANCINITWLVPTDQVYELVLFALTIPQQSREDDFLKIGSWTVYHPKSVLQELTKKYAMASHLTLLMGYYHGLLLRDIDSNLINDMCSEGLLNTNDQKIISTGHSLYHKKWLLLEHVRHMGTKTFLKFCELIANLHPKIGEQLITGADTIKLQPNIQDVTTEIQATLHGHCFNPSLVHIAFLFLIDQVSELLQSCDVKKLVEKCGNIMASDQQNIKLLSGDQIKKLNECSNTLSLLWSLNYFLTWSNHSILRMLLTESFSEALQLLDGFDSRLDPKQSATSYPIPYFSSDMIPDDTSTHTILAIRCDQELYEVTLQYVYDMQSLIVDKCAITQHCLQLLAIRSDPTVIYWTIPKCVINIISSQVPENYEHLYSKGVLEVLVYPEPFLTTVNDLATVNDFIMGASAFIADSRGRNSGEIKTTYSEVDATICSDNVYFVKDFYDHLNKLNLLKKTNTDKPVSLSSVLHGQPFTKQCLNEEKFGIHGFLTRFDAEEVEWFLNKPIGNNKGNTCVHEAVLSQCTEKLDIVLKHGGSPNVKGFSGKTPVHYACEMISKTNKCQEILELLLQHGGDLFEPDNGGVTPLDLLQLCDASFYRTIVQDFCSFNIDDLKSFKKLHRIIQQHGPLQEFKQLYSYTKSSPRYVDSSYHALLFRACKEGWSDGAYFMLSEMKEIPTNSQTMKETPLHAACKGNHYEIVVQLITKFPELLLLQDCLTHRRWHPIHSACAFGASDEILKVLLVGVLCLMTKGHEMIPSTLVHMSFIDALGRTPLYIATKCGNLSHLHLMMTPFLFEALMQSAPTLYTIPSSSTKPWPSPIHCAITYGREELLVSLLNAMPFTVFAYPSVFALRHMLQCIQKDTHNKSINFAQLETTICESSDGELHSIDTSSAINNYEVLKRYKALSNLLLSPLAMASAMGNANVTEILLDKGAKDDDGLALRLALFLQHHDIAGVILSFDDSQICLGNMKKLSTFLLPSNTLNSFIEIHLEDNSLHSIPLVLFQLPNLKFLNVSNNHLVELPVSNDEFQRGWTCNNIKLIYISSNKLQTLPAVIWNMSELKELHADNNCINQIESLANPCAKLKTINISHNELSTVPQHIFLAKEVNISNNRLEYLPECIWKSNFLTNLNVSQNQIKKVCFPESPCNQPSHRLMSIVAKGNRVIAPESKRNISNKSRITYENSLLSLNLSYNKLTNFPKQLTCFAYHLHKLNISNNPICILYICLLPPHMKFMSASNCSLENIEIGENLCDHKNHTSLMNLTFLNLKGNKLKWFQFSFKNDMDPKNHSLIYPELELLDLSNNLLCDLDTSIQNQKHLNSLILNGNRDLNSLPLELSHLSDTLSLLQLDDIPSLTDSHLREYQSHQSSIELVRLFSYMKSALKSTVQFRMINLVIVGAAKSGKTSLMKRLSQPKAKQRLLEDEISICNWELSDANGGKICFRIWDFPSQEKQTAAYFHLYPKQAIYLAVFKLTDGADGTNAIKPLEKHLRNIKAHAPGCPVMIIGTHLDAVHIKYELSQCIHQMYSDTNSFPKIADIYCVKKEGSVKHLKSEGSVKHLKSEGSVRQLKNKIYSVAIRLRYGRRNQWTLGDETDEKKLLNDPSAVLQQHIPQSYLNLQNGIDNKASELKKKGLAPVMNKKEFYEHFSALFEDEGNLVSAVQFLHHQSRLFYFEDQSLDKFYFLDLQWIFSTMMNVLKITDSNGIVSNDKLITSSTLEIRKDLQAGFLALLVKFDFAIPYKSTYAFVHGLLSKDLEDSIPALISTINTRANTKANGKYAEGINLYRMWLASFIPDGFWPQLLTRIISDDRISSILSDFLSIPLSKSRYLSSDLSSLWKLCQKGFLIHYDQTKLLELKEVSNKIEDFTNKLNLSKKYGTRVELTIYTSQIAALRNAYQKISPKQNLTSKLLVVIEQHILDIGEEWFPGTFYDTYSKEVFSYVPCPVGLSQDDDNNGCILHSDNTNDLTHQFLHIGGRNVFCFSVRDLLDAYATQSRSINCPTHNQLLVKEIAPDLCFGDLDDDMLCSPEMPLIIEKENVLGSGASASVLKGKMGPQKIPVAVKRISGYTTTVEEYRLIRREVNFMSALCHPHLTQLSGVHTHPFMLLIELAPLGSLSTILKKYQRANEVLTPAVLQASVYQVASAVNFLHQKHVLHCDLKSSNVLVWKFPLPGQQNSNQQVLLKITDYGISRIYNATNQIRYGTIVGTHGYIAPEVYKGKYKDLQSNKIDVFAFGMVMYELLTLLKPFELLPDSPEASLRRLQRPEIPVSAKENFTPCLFQRIMKACWNQNPNDRPNMAQVVEWSRFSELQSLRTIHQLEPRKLLEICQCQVVRDHVHQYTIVKPENVQSIIPNCDHFKSLFSSLSSQTPPIKRKQSTSNNHTQIWIAQEKDVTTKLTIVTFRSSDLGYYIHEDTTTTKVAAMTSVGHYMWIYTNVKNLHVIQTATLKTIACADLKNSLLEVSQMLHVPEWHTVLVLWELSEIWCLHDEATASGLYKTGSLQLERQIPVCSLCKVTFGNTTEVWVTRKSQEIVILEYSSGCCEKNMVCSTHERHDCQLITCLCFTTDNEISVTHVWVSFNESSQLVCWDGPNKIQLHKISLLCEEEGGHCTSLLGHRNHLYVGTSLGRVEVFDSESGYFLKQFSWHSSKVDALINLPPEIKQSICAESKASQSERKVRHESLQVNFDLVDGSSNGPLRKISWQPPSLQSSNYSRSGVYSLPKQPLSQDYPLIVSLGDNLVEHLNMGNQNSGKRVELLTWTGYPTT